MAIDATDQHRAGMLSYNDFLDLHVEPKYEREYLEAFANQLWDEPIIEEKVAGDMFLIRGFRQLNVTPFSYDLSVGKEAYSLRTGGESFALAKHPAYEVQPGETIIVLTEEYLALPAAYSATIWPRFGMVSEGIFQSMVKIDPTWRGHLAVAMTNVSAGTYPVCRGKTFGTLVLYRLTQPTKLVLCSIPQAKRRAIRQKVDGEIDEREVAEKLKQENLSDFCSFSAGKLQVAGMRRPADFDRLRYIHKSSAWRKAVDAAEKKVADQEFVGMAAYDLTSLDRLLEGPTEAKRLTKEDLDSPCTPSDLKQVAQEYGGPFRVLPGMIDSVLERVAKEIVPRVEAEVGANLFPQIVTLMLRVLGMLSLIAVLVSLGAKYLELGATWHAVIAIGCMFVMFVILAWLLRRPARPANSSSHTLKGPPPEAPPGPAGKPDWRFPWVFNALDRMLSRRRRR